MSTLTFIEGFRKLRSFLAAVFPGLWRALEMLLSPLAKAGRHPRTIRLLERVRATRLGRTAEYIWRNFYWKDHAKYAPDAVRLPADAIAILRPIFITAVALCLLLPLTLKFPGMTLAAEGIEHANTPVAVWSVILWIISQALAWSCLLVGTASSNRPALLLSVVLFIYFAGVAAMGLPRSAWNALVPAHRRGHHTQRPQEMLQGSVRTAATRLPGFMAGKIQDWNRYFPGARAIDFSYEAPTAAGESLLLAGRSVVLPLRHEGPMMLTLTGIFSDWINQQWELARIAQELNRRGY